MNFYQSIRRHVADVVLIITVWRPQIHHISYLLIYLSNLSACLPIYLSIYLSIYIYIYISVYLSIYLSIYPSIHIFIDLSIHPFIYLSS
jgi:hypothetical protein